MDGNLGIPCSTKVNHVRFRELPLFYLSLPKSVTELECSELSLPPRSGRRTKGQGKHTRMQHAPSLAGGNQRGRTCERSLTARTYLLGTSIILPSLSLGFGYHTVTVKVNLPAKDLKIKEGDLQWPPDSFPVACWQQMIAPPAHCRDVPPKLRAGQRISRLCSVRAYNRDMLSLPDRRKKFLAGVLNFAIANLIASLMKPPCAFFICRAFISAGAPWLLPVTWVGDSNLLDNAHQIFNIPYRFVAPEVS